jgi:hypothetical protein
MSSKSAGSSGVGDSYRQALEENIRLISQFPITLQSALILSETMSPSENASTDIKVKTAVSECLNAINAVSKLSCDLELLRDS